MHPLNGHAEGAWPRMARATPFPVEEILISFRLLKHLAGWRQWFGLIWWEVRVSCSDSDVHVLPSLLSSLMRGQAES